MRILLHRVGWKDFRPWKAKSGNVAGSMAWSDVDDSGCGHVYVRRGADKVLCGLARVGHEIEHCLDPSFGNDEHHPMGHLCLRSYFPLRSWDHAKLATKPMARDLRAAGVLEASVA